MAVVKTRPTSPGRRFVVKVVDSSLHRDGPYKPLLEPAKKSGGRNTNGRITTRHRGGGHKRFYRKIDFRRDKDNVRAIVERLEYDPNRSANLALLKYADGERRYIVAPRGVRTGDELMSAAMRLSARECAGVAQHTARQRDSLRGTEAAKGSAARSQRGDIGTACGAGRGLRDAQVAIRRDATGAGRMPRDTGRGRQQRTQSAFPGEGGGGALARTQAHCARRRHESRGSSARGRRGPVLGWTAPGHPVGCADQGLQDADEQTHGRAHRAPAKQQNQVSEVSKVPRSLRKGRR